MSDELAKLAERLRQSRAAREFKKDTLRAGAAAIFVQNRAALQPGARVFDRVTGQEGEVIGGATENIIVPTGK